LHLNSQFFMAGLKHGAFYKMLVLNVLLKVSRQRAWDQDLQPMRSKCLKTKSWDSIAATYCHGFQFSWCMWLHVCALLIYCRNLLTVCHNCCAHFKLMFMHLHSCFYQMFYSANWLFYASWTSGIKKMDLPKPPEGKFYVLFKLYVRILWVTTKLHSVAHLAWK